MQKEPIPNWYDEKISKASKILIFCDTSYYIQHKFGDVAFIKMKSLEVEGFVENRVCSMVLSELEEKKNESVLDLEDNISRVVRTFGLDIDTNNVVNDYIAKCDSFFMQLKNQKVVETTGTDALKALQREMKNALPARNKKGSRDCAIWETLINFRSEDELVCFITYNKNDFDRNDLLFSKEMQEKDVLVFLNFDEIKDSLSKKIDFFRHESMRLDILQTEYEETVRTKYQSLCEYFDETSHEIALSDVVSDEIESYIAKSRPNYDGDGVEIVSYKRTNFECDLEDDPPENSKIAYVYEEWEVECTYGASGTIRYSGGEYTRTGRENVILVIDREIAAHSDELIENVEIEKEEISILECKVISELDLERLSFVDDFYDKE